MGKDGSKISKDLYWHVMGEFTGHLNLLRGVTPSLPSGYVQIITKRGAEKPYLSSVT